MSAWRDSLGDVALPAVGLLRDNLFLQTIAATGGILLNIATLCYDGRMTQTRDGLGLGTLALGAALITLAASGCVATLGVGVDRNFYADTSATGWHIIFGAGATYDPRQKGAVQVNASRRADIGGGTRNSAADGGKRKDYRSDGWEARGDLDLPQAGWRLTSAVRWDQDNAWGTFLGLSRYRPSLAHSTSISIGPSLAHQNLQEDAMWSVGGEVRVSFALDGLLAVLAACDSRCQTEVANHRPVGSSSGSHSWLSSSKTTPTPRAGCYFKSVTDSRGNTTSVWTCP